MARKPVAMGTDPADMEKIQLWLGKGMREPEALPFSFVYGGRKTSGIPAEWKPVVQRRRIDANLVETVVEGDDPATGVNVWVECLAYQDYPVVEWTVWLSNRGGQASPLIEDLLALDGGFSGSAPRLYHCNGDYYSADGYTPRETALGPGEVLRQAPNGGRPCDGAFPYFRIQF